MNDAMYKKSRWTRCKNAVVNARRSANPFDWMGVVVFTPVLGMVVMAIAVMNAPTSPADVAAAINTAATHRHVSPREVTVDDVAAIVGNDIQFSRAGNGSWTVITKHLRCAISVSDSGVSFDRSADCTRLGS